MSSDPQQRIQELEKEVSLLRQINRDAGEKISQQFSELISLHRERRANIKLRFKLIELCNKYGLPETDEADGEKITKMVERLATEREAARKEFSSFQDLAREMLADSRKGVFRIEHFNRLRELTNGGDTSCAQNQETQSEKCCNESLQNIAETSQRTSETSAPSASSAAPDKVRYFPVAAKESQCAKHDLLCPDEKCTCDQKSPATAEEWARKCGMPYSTSFGNINVDESCLTQLVQERNRLQAERDAAMRMEETQREYHKQAADYAEAMKVERDAALAAKEKAEITHEEVRRFAIRRNQKKDEELSTLRAKLTQAEAKRDEARQISEKYEDRYFAMLVERDAALARVEEMSGIIEGERAKCAQAVADIRSAIGRRAWLTEGRGSYEYNDDRWMDEFRIALNEIDAELEKLNPIISDRSYCPQHSREVTAARLRTILVEKDEELSTLRAKLDRVSYAWKNGGGFALAEACKAL